MNPVATPFFSREITQNGLEPITEFRFEHISMSSDLTDQEVGKDAAAGFFGASRLRLFLVFFRSALYGFNFLPLHFTPHSSILRLGRSTLLCV